MCSLYSFQYCQVHKYVETGENEWVYSYIESKMYDGTQDDTEKRRNRKSKKRRRKNKESKSNSRKNKSDKRKSTASIKQKLSKRRGTVNFGKQKISKHIAQTIQIWKLRWKNKSWRQKWKQLWGKSKWKPSIRKKWNADKRWRRKWMKKILKKWWDKKWRRKWIKKWIDNRWLNRWNRRRLRRRRLWKRRWRKSGAKKMGLSFNEFLLTERRLRALQKIHPVDVNRRRKEKRILKEKIIREKMEKREKFNEELNKMGFLKRWYYELFRSESYGPETFGIRPSVIQFKLYFMNMVQGLLAFLVVLYYHLTNKYIIPSEFILHGLYTLVYFATSMDFYGSIFGMVTSYHLESYYGRNVILRKKKKVKKKGWLCCGTQNDSKKTIEMDDLQKGDPDLLTPQISASATFDGESEASKTGFNKGKTRRQSKNGKRNSGSSIHEKQRLDDADPGKSRKKKSIPARGANVNFDQTKSAKGKEKIPAIKKVKCKCRGLGFLYCSIIRKCFRPGRSRQFINRMGYCSWFLLQLAWFLNIFFTAYYSWLELYYNDYKKAVERCNSFPRMKHCDDFEQLYIFLLIIVGVTFSLRNIFLFIIGMCFSERDLKRCRPTDPNDEMASTCSDTDIDYSRVPRQILIPHLLSGGKYPYVLPGPCRPVDYMLGKVVKVTERNRKEKYVGRHSGKLGHRLKLTRKDKGGRRMLTTYEKETAKVLAGFKQIRRAHDPLQKGRRKPIRIPVAIGVTDTHQLPPELMTTKAWTWLYEESCSSDADQMQANSIARHRRPVKSRSRRKRKAKPLDSATLTILHNSKSLTQVPISDIVKPKLENLSERDSTDESWSMKASSLFEPVSGYSSDDEYDHEDADDFMELMKVSHGHDD